MSNYEFIGWNNIDGEYYNMTGKIRPHRLFGNRNVRKALTMAINTNEIIQACLGVYGQPCNSPIAPIFKNEYNSDLTAIGYDHSAAAALLAKEGWIDHNRNGIIDKDGVEFSFTLVINSGNPRREYVANMIKNYLQKIGIEVKVEKLEWNIFDTKTMSRELDAFISGLSVSIDFDLYNFWHSDFSIAQMNDAGFQNKRVDYLIDKINISDRKEAIPFLKEFQEILHEEQPCTFLYWYSNIIGYNKRLKNVNPNILDFYNDISVWQLDNETIRK
jgi:peptide/nickel transport system substrate-binding protein